MAATDGFVECDDGEDEGDDTAARTLPEAGRVLRGCDEAVTAAVVPAIDAALPVVRAAGRGAAVAADAANNEVAPSGMLAINCARF